MSHVASGRLPFHEWVTDAGELMADKLADRETLFVGKSGRAVERFWIKTVQGLRTFIFKPSSYPQTVGRELWVQEHVLPHVAEVRVPRILAHGHMEDVHRAWAIAEDAGDLSHQLTGQDVLSAAQLMAYWHEVPPALLPTEFGTFGRHADTKAMTALLIRRQGEISGLAESLQLREDILVKAWGLAAGLRLDRRELVVNHGDYHVGNIGKSPDGLVIVDWENCHLDVVYYDLFSLLDKTHPRFRKTRHTRQFQQTVLEEYTRARQRLGWGGSSDKVIRDYPRFCAAYSLWMLFLIGDDLRQGLWGRDDLLQQAAETMDALSEAIRWEE